MFRKNGIGGDGGGVFACGGGRGKASGGSGSAACGGSSGGATGGDGSAAAVPTGGAPCLAGGGAAVNVEAFATGCSTLPDAGFDSSCHGGALGITDLLSHASVLDASFAGPGKAVGSLAGAWLSLAGILLDLLCSVCDG